MIDQPGLVDETGAVLVQDGVFVHTRAVRDDLVVWRAAVFEQIADRIGDVVAGLVDRQRIFQQRADGHALLPGQRMCSGDEDIKLVFIEGDRRVCSVRSRDVIKGRDDAERRPVFFEDQAADRRAFFFQQCEPHIGMRLRKKLS